MGGLEFFVLALLCLVPAALVLIIGGFGIWYARQGRRRCPYCAELIQKQAQVCRFCGRDVTPETPGAITD